jgi:single-stranded-DNA-specific exonuclease
MNAAGRMDVACAVVELFSEKDLGKARQFASRLDQLNGDRQQEEARILEAIGARLEGSAEAEALCLVVDGEGWHRGVIGICASRLVDRYFRPALVISRDGDEAHGSGRSIPGFHLLRALEECSHLFTRFGGHAYAVGFAMPAERVPELRELLNRYACACLRREDLEPVLEYDLELSLDEITPALWQGLCRMQPFGIGNPQPVFVTRRARLLAPAKLLKEKHLKLKMARSPAPGLEQAPVRVPVRPGPYPGSPTSSIDALGWGMAARFAAAPLQAGELVEAAFTIDRNEHPDFGGNLELCLRDLTRSQ